MLELFFRFVVPASDYPQLAYVDEVLRYQPGQRGVYRIQDEIAAPFSINAQGWNAARATYVEAKPAGTTRVAIIGDSYVEAFQVPVTRSLAEQLEAMPGSSKLDVLRFGMSGAPFSHYLWMLDRAALRYRPDVVVLNIVHNDFDESYRPATGRYGASLQTLAVDGDRATGFVAPVPHATGLGDLILRSAALRFLRFNRQVSRQSLVAALTGQPIQGVPSGGLKRPQGAGFDEALPAVDANVFIDRLLERPNLTQSAIDVMVARAAALQRQHGFRLLLLMDGVRQAIYEDRNSRALILNRMLADAAQRHGVELVDLHPRFVAAWKADHQPFDFTYDGHWNTRGHAIAAAAVREWLDR